MVERGDGGTIYVDVVPDTSNWDSRLRAGTVPPAVRIGQEISRTIAAPIARAVSDAIRDGLSSARTTAAATRSGVTAGRAWATAFEAATAGIDTNMHIDVDMTEALAQLAAVQAAAENLSASSPTIRAELDGVATAMGQIAALQAALDSLHGPTISVDTAGISSAGSAVTRGVRDGDDYAGAWERAVRARLAAASRSLGRPNIGFGIDAAEWERDLGRIRTEIAELSRRRIGVDISVDDAMARITALQARIETIRATPGIDIQVRFDTSQAVAELEAIREIASRELGAPAGRDTGGEFGRSFRQSVQAALAALPDVELRADSLPAQRVIAGIRAELDGLSGERIGIDVDPGFAMAQLERIQARLRDLAVSSPSIQVRTDTLAATAALARVQAQADRLGASSPTVDVDTSALAASAQIGTSRIWTLVSAGAMIAPVIVPAAAAAASAIVAIGAAATFAAAGIGTIILGGMGVVGAVQAMSQAHKSAGGAASSAASRQKQLAGALDSVRSAERGLIAAQRDALRAQQDLTRAREEERRAQEDLNMQVEDGTLAIRQAKLDLRESREALSSADDPQQARIAYDRAKQQLKELQVQQGRLTEQQQKNTQTGVDGSDRVISAQERVQDAQDRLVAASEQVVSAQRAVQDAMTQTGAGGAAAMNQLQQAMAELSPAGRQFATFIYGLRDDFLTLRRTAETGLLPGVEAGIKSLLPYLPQLNDFVSRVSKALGDMIGNFLTSLSGPGWRNFFSYLSESAVPALQDIGTILANFARGLGSILAAFAPTTEQMSQGLVRLSQRFADWAATLSTNRGFQEFIAYVRENGPKVVDLLMRFGIVLLKLMEGLAPLGAVMLDALIAVFGFLGRLDPGVLLTVIAVIATAAGVIAAALGAVPAAIGAVIIAITALVGAIMYAWRHSEGFRNAMKVVWDGIVAVIRFAWNSVIYPIFSAIRSATLIVISVFTELWRGVTAVFRGIGIAFQAGWAVIQTVFGLIDMIIRGQVAAAFTMLWSGIIGPVWNNFIRPAFLAMASIFRDQIIPAFQAGVAAVGRIWNGLVNLVRTPIRIAIGIINDYMVSGFNRISSVVGGPRISPIPMPFAEGGILPGYAPGRDSILIMASPGEAVLRPEVVRHLGPTTINALNYAARTGSLSTLHAYASGGIINPNTVSRIGSPPSGASPAAPGPVYVEVIVGGKVIEDAAVRVLNRPGLVATAAKIGDRYRNYR